MKTSKMKLLSGFFLALIALASLAFVSVDEESKKDQVDQAYLQKVKEVIAKQHKADFSRSKVKKLSREQVRTWMNQNAQIRSKKLHAADMRVINYVLKQKQVHVIEISNISVADNRFRKILVAKLVPGSAKFVQGSDYLITNEQGDDDSEETKICTITYGYELDLTGTDSPEDVNSRCPCMQESITGSDCEDSGNCAEDCS